MTVDPGQVLTVRKPNTVVVKSSYKFCRSSMTFGTTLTKRKQKKFTRKYLVFASGTVQVR
jgi:hypothetical protein